MNNEPLNVIAGAADRPLLVGDIKIACYVLDDETRVLSGNGMASGLGLSARSLRASARLPRFAGSKLLYPFINNNLRQGLKNPIIFKNPAGGGVVHGYPAPILVDICKAVLEAKEAGVLTKQQQSLAKRCYTLISGFATVGIIALVDEATGYQQIREKNALKKILDKYLTEDVCKWSKTFPDSFWIKLVKIKGYDSYIALKRPAYVGHWVNDVVYSRLAPGIKEKLKTLNPRSQKGHRQHKHWQNFTQDVGLPELKQHINKVELLMDAAIDTLDFTRLINRALPKYGKTIEMYL